jgi:transcriptional regulator with XRE-family HTH domain
MKLSLRELTSRVDVGFTYLSEIEKHKLEDWHSPSEKLLQSLAFELGGDEEELLMLAGKLPEPIRRRVIASVNRPAEGFQALTLLLPPTRTQRRKRGLVSLLGQPAQPLTGLSLRDPVASTGILCQCAQLLPCNFLDVLAPVCVGRLGMSVSKEVYSTDSPSPWMLSAKVKSSPTMAGSSWAVPERP